MMNIIDQLAQHVADVEFIFDAWLLARVNGQLVLVRNYTEVVRDERDHWQKTRYHTEVVFASGERQNWLDMENIRGGERINYPRPLKLEVPVEQSVYDEFYKAWARSASTTDLCGRRLNLIELERIAREMPNLSGGE